MQPIAIFTIFFIKGVLPPPLPSGKPGATTTNKTAKKKKKKLRRNLTSRNPSTAPKTHKTIAFIFQRNATNKNASCTPMAGIKKQEKPRAQAFPLFSFFVFLVFFTRYR